MVKLNNFYLYLSGFFAGMSVTALEMSASRLLAPYFGTSLFVWTSVIGVTLLSLSIGYFIGGRLIDRHPRKGVYFGVLLIAGVLGMLIPFLNKPFSEVSLLAGSSFSVQSILLLLSSLLAMILLFALPLAMLGMVSPCLIRLLSTGSENAGKIAGNIFFLTTLGSLLGAFLPAIVFIPILGTKKTIIIFSAILVLFGLAIFKRRHKTLLIMLLVLITGLELFLQNKIRPGVLYEKETPYQYAFVREDGEMRYLQFNEGLGIQTAYNQKDIFVGDMYYDYFTALPFLRADENKDLNVLIIGLAGGTIARQYHSLFAEQFHLQIDGVEIDKQIVEIGKKYFVLENPSLNINIADGRMFLQNTDKLYDIIIVDAYSQQLYIPFHLATKEFYTEASRHLNSDGVLAINVNAFSDQSKLLQGFTKTLESVFPQVYLAKVSGISNYLLIGSFSGFSFAEAEKRTDNQEIKSMIGEIIAGEIVERSENSEIFTDDRAPIELLTDNDIWNYFRSETKGL